MKIAIDAVPLLSPLTGVGHYTKQLIIQFNRLAPSNDYFYFYGYFTNRFREGTAQTHRLKDSLWKIPYLRYGIRKARDLLSRVHWKEFDLYFEPNFIPLDISAKKTVTTIHDFSTLQYPSFHPRDRVRDHAKHLLTRIELANKIITVSSFIQTEAMRFLSVPKERIVAIPLGVDHGMFKKHDPGLLDRYRRELGLPAKFILFVGAKEPRKNLVGLAKAFLALPSTFRAEFKLVLAGPAGWNAAEINQVLETLGNSVIDLGYVESEVLCRIYNLATLLVFPSFYEGFGLPPLEAMACGCPVIVSNVAALPETCGPAAYYVDPNEVEEIAGGMQKLITDECFRRNLIDEGMRHARLFSWERTASATLKIFEEVLDVRKEGQQQPDQ